MGMLSRLWERKAATLSQNSQLLQSPERDWAGLLPLGKRVAETVSGTTTYWTEIRAVVNDSPRSARVGIAYRRPQAAFVRSKYQKRISRSTSRKILMFRGGGCRFSWRTGWFDRQGSGQSLRDWVHDLLSPLADAERTVAQSKGSRMRSLSPAKDRLGDWCLRTSCFAPD